MLQSENTKKKEKIGYRKRHGNRMFWGASTFPNVSEMCIDERSKLKRRHVVMLMPEAQLTRTRSLVNTDDKYCDRKL